MPTNYRVGGIGDLRVDNPDPNPTPTPTPTPNPTPPVPPTPTPGDQYSPDYRKAHPELFDTNISEDQWKTWEKNNLKSGCPPNAPFAGRSGQCASKPDDCPEGQQVVGNDQAGTAKCVPVGSANPNPPPPPPPAPTPGGNPPPPPPPQGYVPPQINDPLHTQTQKSIQVGGLGGTTIGQSVSSPYTTPEQQKKKVGGLQPPMSPSIGTQQVSMGMH